MLRIGVLGDVEVLLHLAARIGEKRPVRSDAAAEFGGLQQIVGADGHHPAVTHFHLAVELDEALVLPAFLGTIAAAREDQHQRIRALQRRTEVANEPVGVIEHLGVCLDRVKHKVTLHGRELDLTPTEFRLLECLLRQPGRAFSRAQLMDAAIGEGAVVLERTIDVHVKTLRRKLGDGDLIETVRGVGYRFREKREVWVDAVKACLPMFWNDSWEYHGTHFDFPARNVIPKPRQRPHPPLWVACTRLDTIRMAGVWGR